MSDSSNLKHLPKRCVGIVQMVDMIVRMAILSVRMVFDNIAISLLLVSVTTNMGRLTPLKWDI